MLDLDGKTVLVSLRKIDDKGQETFDTYFGTVAWFNENTVCVTRNGGQEHSLPYDEEVYEPAEPGVYELEDGSVLEDLDFIARWTVFASQEERN